ncbi:MAG: IMS domain-containing protein [Xenococcaceae cyanobacterium MO_188.B19]|nr:IMS domain-containing protein [Xenococcaceae cyanobacterium MO_188.B19]
MSNNQLITAAISGNIAELKSQINAGTDINLKDNNGQTALMHAAYKGNVAMVKLLLENNADPNIEDNDSWTAFRYAEEFSKTDVAELLRDVTLTTLKEENKVPKNCELFSTTATNTKSVSEIKSSTNKRDWRDSLIIGSLIGAAILIGLVVTRNPSPSVSSSSSKENSISSSKTSSVQRRNTSINTQKNISNTLTEQKAVDLINNWQNAKRKIFAYPFDLQLLKKYQTDKKYQDNVGSVNWLRNNNAYYKYGVQSVDSVEEFIASGDRATIDAVVTEQRTFYMNNKVINDGNTAFDTRLVRYNLVSENGQWKIEDYNTVKKIKTR